MKVTNPPAGVRMTGPWQVGRKMDTTSGRGSFERSFRDSDREGYDQKIADLAKKIDEQGARLTKKIDIAEMERYRALVSELLNEVVSNAYAFRKENSFDSRGKRQVYATVMKINEKLEKMAKDILGGHGDALEMIGNIDDIRGLIVDILL